jgi:hypothetical protein
MTSDRSFLGQLVIAITAGFVIAAISQAITLAEWPLAGPAGEPRAITARGDLADDERANSRQGARRRFQRSRPGSPI